MKRWVSLILSLIGMAIMLACSDSEPREESTMSLNLSRRHVEIAVGDTAEVWTSGNLDFTLESADAAVATARREGRKAIITANAVGETTVTFLTRYRDSSCTVTVVDKDKPINDDDKALDDATPRITGSGISLVYGTAGIMITSTAGTMQFINIATAEMAELSFSNNSITNISLNGVTYGIATCTLCKETPETLWYRLTLNGTDTPILAVLERTAFF